MRLLNTKSFELKEFFGKNIPKYSILSHRWEDEEVTYQDVISSRMHRMKGWQKIKRACAQAVSSGREYLWADTCCIDKTSSAELSEAINSMFGWYQNAQICYVYLSDVPGNLSLEQHVEKDSSFRKSLWFTRGWTLQEFLAPEDLWFFDCEWQYIVDKFERSIQQCLLDITGITSFRRYREASVAQKMSWLAKRETTREEDMAYCMLGIFGVYMPPLYGEGNHAFHRLQLEILKTSDDESIFAWKASLEDAHKHPSRGMLADKPTEFVDAGSITSHPFYIRSPFGMTNKGLQIQLLMVRRKREFTLPQIYEARLNCKINRSSTPVSIYIKEQPGGYSFERVVPNMHAPIGTSPILGFVLKSLRSLLVNVGEAEMETHDLVFVRKSQEALYPIRTGTPVFQFQLELCGQELQDCLYDIVTSKRSSLQTFWMENTAYTFTLQTHDFHPLSLQFKPSFGETEESVLVYYLLCFTVMANQVMSALQSSREGYKIFHNPHGRNDHIIVKMHPHRLKPLLGPWRTNGWSIAINKNGDQLRLEKISDIHYKLHLDRPST